ncbi:MAG: hypothetical protein IJW46_05245 [Clostridia bacterium]|nr:hypothetical protein [Clostridia bacterium]
MLNSLVSMLYIDPSTVSVLAVSLGSMAIAIGTTVVIWYRRAKKKVAETFHIDENANKEVEEELVILDEETNNQ